MNKTKKSTDKHCEMVAIYLEQCTSSYEKKTDKKDSHAEVFDTHPITRMKDMESVGSNKVLIITDAWKHEWCKNGVQVPTKRSNEQKKAEVIPMSYNFERKPFILPNQLIRTTNKHKFNPESHIWTVEASNTNSKKTQPERQFIYEIDMLDSNWLVLTNQERSCLGLKLVTNVMLEAVFEIIERLCFRRIQSSLREIETEFLEHDENSRCDICQNPDGEDNNELVFCEDCFVCVHQACYGIPELPTGAWICRYCERKPSSWITGGVCALCPNRGGAMKPFDHDPDLWGHVSCAVWIPELGFGDVERMEPILRLNGIPAARWNLRCHLCKQYNVGAPIQCSNKKCKMAFHVTCAIKNELIMNQEISDTMDVNLSAYCKTHTRLLIESGSKKVPLKKCPEDIRELRIDKQKELELKFHELVSLSELKDPCFEHPNHLFKHVEKMPDDILQKIFTYWKLKRISRHHQCLIEAPPAWSQQQQAQRVTNRTALSTFCKIRFGLDRARLIMDLVKRREKMKSKVFEAMCSISSSQLNQLKSSLNNAILMEDPSLASNWGFIVGAHLDDNTYVNPEGILDPVVGRAVKEKKEKDDTMKIPETPSVKPLRATSKTVSKNVEKTSRSLIASSTTKKPGTSKQSSETNKSPQVLLDKSNLCQPETNMDDPDMMSSCVSKIPRDHLIIDDDTKLILTAKLREPMFFCNYLVNKYNTPKPKSTNSENVLILEVPEESDSSNLSSNVKQLSVLNRKRKSSDCTFPTPASKLPTVNVSPSKLSPRNLFDDILTTKKPHH